jgi:pantoate--beta-alanine ligase
MQVIADIAEFRRWRSTAQGPVGLVPTMGALHAGHLRLVAAAHERSATVVTSVFVNPMQFAPGEDLATYPRDLDGDIAKLAGAGVDAVFTPAVEAFVPDDLATTVAVAGVTETLEGAFRPGHFDGVATIVTKLLNVTQPAIAVFGEKDYQQLTMIRRMVVDLDLPVEVVAVPIVRDDDGLALSSRNVHLSADERARALTLPAALRRAGQSWTGDADAAREELVKTLVQVPGIAVDYAEVVDERTLEALHGRGHRRARALVAARVGATRLIDNLLLAPSTAAARDPRRPTTPSTLEGP